MNRKLRTPPVTDQSQVAPVGDTIEGYLACLPNPPWDLEGFSWPKPQGTNRDAFLAPLADSVDQAAGWVETNTHGPRWLSMLRELVAHLDLGCGLPEHGVAVQQISEHVEPACNSAEERESAAKRLKKIAEGMRFYLKNFEPKIPEDWEAPNAWDKIVGQTAHAIHEEIQRAALYCRAWNAPHQNHPCGEGDTAGELWSRPWACVSHPWFAQGCRVQIQDGDVLERELRNYIQAHRPHAFIACESVFLAIKDHNHEVSKLPPRALKDLGSGIRPSFLTWSQNLRKLASDWRILVCTESQTSTKFSMEGPSKTNVTDSLSQFRKEEIKPKRIHPSQWRGKGKLRLLEYLLKNPTATLRKNILSGASQYGAGKGSSVDACLSDLIYFKWLDSGELGMCLNSNAIEKAKKVLK